MTELSKELHEMTPEERWEEGIEHNPESLDIRKFFEDNDPHGLWEFGGNGDNGEDMLYLLDCYFAKKEHEVQEIIRQLQGGGLNAFHVTRIPDGNE